MSNTTRVLLALAAALILCASCCSGCLFLINLGETEIAKDIGEQLQTNATVKKHLGQIKTLDVNWSKSILISPDDGVSDDSQRASEFVYEVDGTLNRGELVVTYHMDDQSRAVVDTASLLLSNGERIEILVEPR